jgi:general secretion pathway protein J
MMRHGMIRYGRNKHATVSGFTLLEALVATALMGVILTALASITSQWLPNWNRGIARAQRSELVSIVLDRLVADVGASEFISPNRDTKAPIFDGTEFSVTLVRSSVGPNIRPGLEIVRITELNDKSGKILVRSTKPFAPFVPNTVAVGQPDFANPVVLLRSPYRISFAYAGRDGIWKTTWQNASELPAAVRLTVRDATSGRMLSVSTTALVHVDVPAACASEKGKDDCTGLPGGNNDQPNNNPAQASPAKQRT